MRVEASQKRIAHISRSTFFFSTKIPHTHHIETGDLEFDLLFVGAHVVNPHLQGQRWILRTGSIKSVFQKKEKGNHGVKLSKGSRGILSVGKTGRDSRVS
jgi:hypothetical protein